jgi:hypothetical protein
MSKYYVAFYRGKGSIADKVVSWATQSPYSHCELIRSETRPSLGDTVECISASGRDKGVRIKSITLKPQKWEIYATPWAPDDAWDRAAEHLGAPYELWMMVFSQLFNFRRHSKGKWYCSELVAYALKFEIPHAKSPGDLYRAVKKHKETWLLALEHASEEPVEKPGPGPDDEDHLPVT